MSKIETVPLLQLALSQHNIRHTQKDLNLEQLAASIRAEGLINPLTGARVPPDDESPLERIDVVAGGRRLRALLLLADRDQLPESLRDGIPVNIVPAGLANEIGLAENVVREKMHAHDEFVAFRDLANSGKSSEEIAARFGVTPLVVERRLRLANVAPEILQAFRQDQVSLDVMMAFALTDDWTVQRRIFDDGTARGGRLHADNVRRAVAQKGIASSDKRVRFVGLDAYEAAGGTVLRDLFDDKGGGYVADETLLDQLTEEKLQAESKKLFAEGWKFVHVVREGERGWEFTGKCRRSTPRKEARTLTAEQQERVAAIEARLAEIERAKEEFSESDDYDADRFDSIDAEGEDLQAELDSLSATLDVWTDRQKAKAGCMLELSYHGVLEVTRGLIPAEGSKAERTANVATAAATGKKPEPVTATLTEAMVRRLTAHRQVALQVELMKRPDVALATLAYALLLNILFPPEYDGDNKCPLEVKSTSHVRDHQGFGFADLDGSANLAALFAAIGDLRKTLGVSERRAQLYPWLLQQPPEVINQLLALVAVCTVDTVQRHAGGAVPGALLAEALNLDMADHWQPTAVNFGSLVPKSLAVEAVREVCGDADAARVEAMKKDEAAGECERLIATSRWLPKPLRRPGYSLKKKTATSAPAEAPPPRSTKTNPAGKTTARAPAAKKSSSKSKPAAKKVAK
jgi:ParB family chromosome partitioning protein